MVINADGLQRHTIDLLFFDVQETEGRAGGRVELADLVTVYLYLRVNSAIYSDIWYLSCGAAFSRMLRNDRDLSLIHI